MAKANDSQRILIRLGPYEFLVHHFLVTVPHIVSKTCFGKGSLRSLPIGYTTLTGGTNRNGISFGVNGMVSGYGDLCQPFFHFADHRSRIIHYTDISIDLESNGDLMVWIITQTGIITWYPAAVTINRSKGT